MKGILSIVCYCFEWVMARNGTALRRCAVQTAELYRVMTHQIKNESNVEHYLLQRVSPLKHTFSK